MENPNGLYLHEEVMLLALRDEKGTIESGTMYQFAIAGAIIAELLLEGRIRLEQRKKKQYAVAHGLSHVGDDLMDECLMKIRDAKRPAQLQDWVIKFSGISKLKHRIAVKLSRKGILRVDEDKVLGFFSRTIYPEINPEPEKELRERLRRAIFSDTDEIDPRTVVLLALAQQGDLLNVAFEKKELKKRKERIEQIVNGNLAGKATREAVEAIQAAILVTTIVPVIVTT